MVPGEFRVRLAWEKHFAGDATPPVQTEVCLERVGGGVISLGAGAELTQRSPIGGWSDQKVKIPPEAVAGKFRLFVRFLVDGKIVGESHGMRIEVGG
jgi:hypothetical protein